MPHYTYIIHSIKDSSFYIGYSANPEQRLIKHNNANKGYTSTKKPWKLVYIEVFESKTEALKREKLIKAQKSREYILKLIQQKS
ncbi:GIY-YIG nuclease family protein [Jiulongibacter sp. NS-SX5]|uniref:GIY-YIG nuclease family protein n=1 Tax=Jiulongibacter sp. NS-SX5 TaxID=3463854 RepID=UPI00405963A1